MGVMDESWFGSARARVLADLQARGLDSAAAVSALEDSLAQRRWWAEQWPAGAEYVAGLVAQDVQDALFDSVGRWPECLTCAEAGLVHSLALHPDLGGPDPHWVCEEAGREVGPLGGLLPW